MEKLKSLYVGSLPFLTALEFKSPARAYFAVAFPTYVSANTIGRKTVQSLSLSVPVAEVTWLK